MISEVYKAGVQKGIQEAVIQPCAARRQDAADPVANIISHKIRNKYRKNTESDPCKIRGGCGSAPAG